ncbi:hypothetical protein ACFLWU_03410 [Chloroflexota bacterium]
MSVITSLTVVQVIALALALAFNPLRTVLEEYTARILAIAGTCDAMISRRPYRQLKASQEQAIEELQRCARTHSDPKIVRVFVNLLRNEPQLSKPMVEVKMRGKLNRASSMTKFIKAFVFRLASI